MLHIQKLELIDTAYAVRFGGEKDDFLALVNDLKFEGCYWDAVAFDCKGGWIVEHDTLIQFKDRFDNTDRCINRVRDRQRVAQLRVQGNSEDINSCPF